MELNTLDKLLETQGLQYEDLSEAEKDTYNKANFSLQKLTVADVKSYVTNMKNAIALQVSEIAIITEEDKEKDRILKGRLKNYILMEIFLEKPDKAEEALKRTLKEKGKVTA
jgi:hypothetical protein